MLPELTLHLGHQPQMVGVRQLFQSSAESEACLGIKSINSNFVKDQA